MNIVVVESPAKAKTINRYLGPDYKVLASYGHVRDLPSKDGSVDPDDDFAMIWDVDRQGAEAPRRHRRGRQGRRQADPRHRPRPRGRGDLLARAGGAEAEAGHQGPDGRARRLQRHHQAGGDRGDEAPARHRHGAGRCLSRPPRARLSGRLHPVAGAVAQAAGRALGRPRAVGGAAAGLRPRARDRGVQHPGILVGGGRRWRRRRRALRGAAGQRRRQEARAARHRHRRRAPRRSSRRSRRAAFTVARSRPSRPGAIRRRPSPPRPCSRRPRASSASRPPTPCRSRSGSTRASTSAARPSASSPTCAPTACRSPPEAIAAAASVIGTDYGKRLCARQRRATTRSRPRTPRKRTRRSARPTSTAPRRVRCRLDADQAKLYELIWKRMIASQMESAELERTTVDLAARPARPDSACAPPARWSSSTASSRSTRKAATTSRRRRGVAPPARR